MLSTSGDVQYIGICHEYTGEYLEYIKGVLSTSEGYHDSFCDLMSISVSYKG